MNFKKRNKDPPSPRTGKKERCLIVEQKNSGSVQMGRFFRFMRLFRITLFSVVSIESGYIYAIVAWEEDCVNGLPELEDSQMVRWSVDDDSIIEDALMVGECAYESGWIDMDRLNIDLKIISDMLGWSQERIVGALDKLKKIKAIMIDNNEKGDAFFLHD